jgi:pyruvate dehydrogenase E2 component (dihydrolipoamide acetyltransferase)
LIEVQAMPYAVVIPRLGLTMETGRVVQWYKHSGEHVKLGELLFSVESDKAVQDIEALAEGAVYPLPNLPDEPLPIATLIGYILAPGETLPADVAGAPVAVQPATQPAPPTAAPSVPVAAPLPVERKFSSPAARRRAKELGLDWRTIERAGGGPILLAHVEQAASGARPAVSSEAARVAPSPRSAYAAVDTLTVEADATALVTLQGQLQAALAARKQAAPSYADLFARIATCAANKLGEMRRGRGEEAGAQPLSPGRADLQASSPLPATELGLATVYVGEQGADSASLSLDAGQAALLAVGRIAKRPAEWHGELVLRQRVALSLTFDHTALPREVAGRLLDAVRALVEQPYLLLAG